MIDNMYGSYAKKRFILFAIIQHEASGGMGDVIGTFHTQEEAKNYTHHYSFDYYHIFDTEEFTYIEMELPL